MVSWFRRARERIEVPRLTPRSDQRATERVDLAELTPTLEEFLALSAYLQLSFFESLGDAVSQAPTTQAKSVVARVAGRTLDKHEKLAAEIARLGDDPVDVMQPFVEAVERFRLATHGAEWHETLLTCYITTGFLDEFFVRLGAGLRGEAGERAVAILKADSGADELVSLLQAGIDADAKLASRLAMWGRRLVGDTMLVARSALVMGADQDSDEARIEPVFTELIAMHTRRMDVLGLTA